MGLAINLSKDIADGLAMDMAVAGYAPTPREEPHHSHASVVRSFPVPDDVQSSEQERWHSASTTI
jgi:hypothetical protein